jgi:hypothetical protein
MHSLREIANGYRIDFSDDEGEPPYMSFDVTYIDTVTWGLLATVTVRSRLPNASRLPDDILFMDRVNLMKGRELRDMATRIDALIPPPKSAARLDWHHHLEHVAVLVNAHVSQPVAAVALHERSTFTKPRFVIPGLLVAGKANILYGPGGTGKSLLALRIAGSVASGVSLFDLPVIEPGPVLYLDWEDDADTLGHRLHLVSKGMSLRTPFDVTYKCLHGRGAYERHHADVKWLVESKGIRLVIMDSTALAMHGSTAGDGADGAIKFFQLLGELGATTLLIDHVSSDDVKAVAQSERGAAKPYGSVFKVNSARNVWEISPWRQQVLTGFTLRHRKTNAGPRMDDIDVAVTWDEESIVFESLGTAANVDEDD